MMKSPMITNNTVNGSLNTDSQRTSTSDIALSNIEDLHYPIIKSTGKIVTTFPKNDQIRGHSDCKFSHVNQSSKVTNTHSTSICHPGLDALLNKSLNAELDNHFGEHQVKESLQNGNKSNQSFENLFTIEQIELIKRLKKTGVKRDQVAAAFSVIDKLEKELNGLFDFTFKLLPFQSMLVKDSANSHISELRKANSTGPYINVASMASPDSLNLDLVISVCESINTKYSQTILKQSIMPSSSSLALGPQSSDSIKDHNISDKDLNFLLSLPINYANNDILNYYASETQAKNISSIQENGAFKLLDTTCDLIDIHSEPTHTTHQALTCSFFNQHKHITNKLLYTQNSAKPKAGLISTLSPMALYQILMKKILSSIFIKGQKSLLINSLMDEANKSIISLPALGTVINNAMAISTFFSAMVLTSSDDFSKPTNGLDFVLGDYLSNEPTSSGVNGHCHGSHVTNQKISENTISNSISSALSHSHNFFNSIAQLKIESSCDLFEHKDLLTTSKADHTGSLSNDYTRSIHNAYAQSYNLHNYMHQEYFDNMDLWKNDTNSSFASLIANNYFFKKCNLPQSIPSGLFMPPDVSFYKMGCRYQPDINYYNSYFPSALTNGKEKDFMERQRLNSSQSSTLDSDQETNEDELLSNLLVSKPSPVDNFTNARLKEDIWKSEKYVTKLREMGKAKYIMQNIDVDDKIKNSVGSKICQYTLPLLHQSTSSSVTKCISNEDLNDEDIKYFAKKGTKKCAELIREFIKVNGLNVEQISLATNLRIDKITCISNEVESEQITEENFEQGPEMEGDQLTQGSIKRKIQDIMENLYNARGTFPQNLSPFYPITNVGGGERKKATWGHRATVGGNGYSGINKPLDGKSYYDQLKQAKISKATNEVPSSVSSVLPSSNHKSGSGAAPTTTTYKRERFTFKSGHLEILERFFKEDAYPDGVRREYIAETCNTAMTRLDGRELLPRERVTTHVVANWFANRRKESRRQKKTKDNTAGHNSITTYPHDVKSLIVESFNKENINGHNSDKNFQQTLTTQAKRENVYRFSPNAHDPFYAATTCQGKLARTEVKKEESSPKAIENNTVKNGCQTENHLFKCPIPNLDEEMDAVNTTIMALVNQHGIEVSNNNAT